MTIWMAIMVTMMMVMSSTTDALSLAQKLKARTRSRTATKVNGVNCPISKKGFHEYRVAGYELLALKRSAEAKRCFEEAMSLYLTRIGQYHSSTKLTDYSSAELAKAAAVTQQFQASQGLSSAAAFGGSMNMGPFVDGPAGGPFGVGDGGFATGKRLSPSEYPGAGAIDIYATDPSKAGKDLHLVNENAPGLMPGQTAPSIASPIDGLSPSNMPVPLDIEAGPPRDVMGEQIARLRAARVVADNRHAAAQKRLTRTRGGDEIIATEAAAVAAAGPVKFWKSEVERDRADSEYDRQLDEQRRQFADERI